MTWQRSDEDSIREYAIQRTTQEGGNASAEATKNTSEIMEEFNMERCAFDEDSLFAFVVFRD